jgi:IS1 family transposase
MQMNRLPIDKKVQIIHQLLEGSSIRSTSRLLDVTPNTVLRVFKDVARACSTFHNHHVRNLSCERIEADEVWSFVQKKQKRVTEYSRENGDVWTFLAIDADSKLVISILCGKRDLETATYFMSDLAARVIGKFQLSTDGYKPYVKAVHEAFEKDRELDYGQLVKIYSKPGEDNHTDNEKSGHYKYAGSRKDTIFGTPNHKFTTTAHMERKNLTMRTNIRRFTRETNGFSKKLENHYYSQCLHFVYYNFCRIHSTIRVTPAMHAGLSKKPMTIREMVELSEER